MAHGVSGTTLPDETSPKAAQQKPAQPRKPVGVMGSRRIFAPAFKIKVLDSYRNDIDCRGNQRATARKYGIHRRQIQKWLQCEDNLRSSCGEGGAKRSEVGTLDSQVALNLSRARLHGDEAPPPLGKPEPAPFASGAILNVPANQASYDYPGQIGYAEQERPFYELASPCDVGGEVKVYQTLASYPGERFALGDADDGQTARRYDPAELEHGKPPIRRCDSRGYGSTEVAEKSPSHRYEPTEIAADAIDRGHRYHRSQETIDAEDRVAFDRRYEPVAESRSSPAHRYDNQERPDRKYAALNERKSYESYASYESYETYETYESAGEKAAATTKSYEEARGDENGRTHHGPLDEQRRPKSLESASGEEEAGSRCESAIKTERASPDSLASSPPLCHPLEHPLDPRRPTSVHSHVRERAHEAGRSRARADSEKPSPREREQPGELDGAVVKEEPHLDDDETNVNYERPSEPPEGLYPSPEPSLSDRSSTSCSDSEMDALDCSPGSQGSSTDLARRRSFSLRFKLDVLDAFHRDAGVAGNQRATARKFGINRRQVQKWLGQETELRGEIALRGNARQRLGPVQDPGSAESPVDLRTNYAGSVPDRGEDYDRSPVYCCDSSQAAYYGPTDVEPRVCTLSCCYEAPACFQEAAYRGPCYDVQGQAYCYSRDYPDGSDATIASPLKRQHCALSCCYEPPSSSPKRLCVDPEDPAGASRGKSPPQETPLCLVKPKAAPRASPVRREPVTSTVPTPSKKDAILFKPYLDNPVSKPKDPVAQRLSPVSTRHVMINNNNNCQSICNLNEDNRGHDYALELSLRVPVSWRGHQGVNNEFPQVRSAFVRYPASPRYT